MLTDPDKQVTGNREPADETNEEDPMQGILVWLQPFTVNLEDLEAQCSHIPLKERNQIRKVMLQKWRHKNGSMVFMLTSAKTKRDLFCEQKSMVTWQQQSTKSSTKNVNLGTTTDTLPWCTFSPLNGIRVKPKLHRRRRRLYESLQKPSQKPKVIHTHKLASILKKYHGIIERLHFINQRQAELSERAARRAKEETSAILLQSGSDDKWWWDSMECYCCLGDDQDLLADGKSQNERRFGESFVDMLCSRVEFGKKIFWLLRLKN